MTIFLPIDEIYTWKTQNFASIFQMFLQMDLLKRNLRCVYENYEATVMYMYFISVLYIIFVV